MLNKCLIEATKGEVTCLSWYFSVFLILLVGNLHFSMASDSVDRAMFLLLTLVMLIGTLLLLQALIDRLNINRVNTSPSPARTVSASLSPEHKSRRSVAPSPMSLDSVYTRTRSHIASHRRVRSHPYTPRAAPESTELRSLSPLRPTFARSDASCKDTAKTRAETRRRTRSASQCSPALSEARRLANTGAFKKLRALRSNSTSDIVASPLSAHIGSTEPPVSLRIPISKHSSSLQGSTPFGFGDSSPFSPTFGLNSASSPQMNELIRTPLSSLGVHRQPTTTSDSDGVLSPNFTPRQSSLSDATNTSVGSSSTEIEPDEVLSSLPQEPNSASRSSTDSSAQSSPVAVFTTRTQSRARSTSTSSTNTVIVPPRDSSPDADTATTNSNASSSPVPAQSEPLPRAPHEDDSVPIPLDKDTPTTVHSSQTRTIGAAITPITTENGQGDTISDAPHSTNQVDSSDARTATKTSTQNGDVDNCRRVNSRDPESVVMSSAEEILEPVPISKFSR